MTFRLALCGLLSAACLAGCSSAPKLTEPSGQWENMPVHRSSYAVAPVPVPIAAAVPAQTYAAPITAPVYVPPAQPATKPPRPRVDRVVPVSKPAAPASSTEASQP